MRSAARRGGIPFAALTLFIGTVAALVMPAPPAASAVGFVAAVLAIVVVSTVAAMQVVPAGMRVGSRAHAVLERMVPRAAQSDPDARGHARPRAPGAVLPAV